MSQNQKTTTKPFDNSDFKSLGLGKQVIKEKK
jgi:hypothetical protein